MATLLCTVRGCGLALARVGGAMVCERRHSFDVARSGYLNLLQPQDRRSSHPGDSAEAVAARRRFLETGYESHALDRVIETVEHLSLPDCATVLDVGCGEGYYLGALASSRAVDATGLDISVAAVDLAARAYPNALWIVANADRTIPVESESVDVVLSITSRRNASEFRRVLRPNGRALVVVPAADDLAELREVVLGRSVVERRVERVVAELAPAFELESASEVRRRVRLDRSSIADALAMTYRGARKLERERLASIEEVDVTLSRDVLVFRRASRTPS